jgi:hypothetical protein
VTSISTAFNTALAHTSKELTRQVQSLTSRAGWPDGVCDALRVEYRNGAFAVMYPDSLQATVDVLENGTQDQQPSGVLRRFENSVVRKGGAVLLHFVSADLKKARII